MSWFDTSNIVSLAKSTLKEAQKTIDKALDISEEDDSNQNIKSTTSDTGNKVISEPSTPFANNSIWGSFTGSFFEATSPDSSTGDFKEERKSSEDNTEAQNSLQESFSLIKQRSNQSKLKKQNLLLTKSLDESKRTIDKIKEKDKDNTYKLDIKKYVKESVEDETIKKISEEKTIDENQKDEIPNILDPSNCSQTSNSVEISHSIVQSNDFNNSSSSKIKRNLDIGNDKKEVVNLETKDIQSNVLQIVKEEMKKDETSFDKIKHEVNDESILISPPETSEVSTSLEKQKISKEIKNYYKCTTSDEKNNERKVQSTAEETKLKELNEVTTNNANIEIYNSKNDLEKIVVKNKEKSNEENVVKMTESSQHSQECIETVSKIDNLKCNTLLKSTDIDHDEESNKIIKKDDTDVVDNSVPSMASQNITNTSAIMEEETIKNIPKTLDIKENVLETINKQEIIYRKKSTNENNEKRKSDRISMTSLNSKDSNSGGGNRLSTFSSDSNNRLSSDSNSIEIITTPDSSLVTSPSIEITSESDKSHQRRSSESIEVIKSGEEDEDNEEELSCSAFADDSYQSMSESTQTITTAMNVMLKSTSSLENSFSDMTSSKENVFSSRTSHNLHAMSNQYSTLTPSSVGDAQENAMDGSASTLVGSSDDGTFVHVRDSTSPTSSYDRCEMVKLGSSHTSGDEMDTNTTSSSIEIISSPNGEGSSTTSRQSPAKLVYRTCGTVAGSHIYNKNKIPLPISADILPEYFTKVKTHQRVPSETSSGGSEDTEMDKLHKKLTEMTEVLEAREVKLLDLSRHNGELNDITSVLKQENQNMLRMNEEFTQRLSTLEKQCQQTMKEKETLRRQLEVKKLAETNQQHDEDKDEIIKELREEGEKLSKQQLILNTTIKKLRNSEKENNKNINNLKEELQEKIDELERNKKLVQVKEDVERTQIEAVNQLSKTNSRLEREVNGFQQQIDNLTTTLVASQKELRDRKNAITEMEKRLEETAAHTEAELRKQLELEFSLEVERRQELQSNIDQLRSNVISMEQQHSQREEKLRKENTDLLRRLEEAQSRIEQLSESMISATKPLTQQIESLTSSHSAASEAWDLQERALNQTIDDLQSRLSSLRENEKSCRDQNINMSSKISALELKLDSEHKDVIRLREELKNMNEDIEKLNTEKESISKAKDELINQLTNDLKESKRVSLALEQQLSVERAAVESEKRRNVSLQDQLSQSGQSTSNRVSRASVSPPHHVSVSQRSSPTLSFGRAASVADSVFPALSDDGEHGKSVYETMRMGSTTLIENLQSQVKLRDGEVQHLQWELNRKELERTSLSQQVTELSSKVEEMEKTLCNHTELQTQYDALLQMYGGTLEECQELRMDLEDIKQMYKAQIDQLLKKDESG